MSNQSHKIAAIILAAGASRRFGGGKQFAKVNGEGLLAGTIGRTLEAGCTTVLVVNGHRRQETEDVASRFSVTSVHNPEWEKGMQTSVISGLQSLLKLADWQYSFLLPCDLPWFTVNDFEDFKVARFTAPTAKADIVAIGYPDGPGIPLLLSREVVEAYLSEKIRLPLRKFIGGQGSIVLLPTGKRTRDIDYREDIGCV